MLFSTFYHVATNKCKLAWVLSWVSDSLCAFRQVVDKVCRGTNGKDLGKTVEDVIGQQLVRLRTGDGRNDNDITGLLIVS